MRQKRSGLATELQDVETFIDQHTRRRILSQQQTVSPRLVVSRESILAAGSRSATYQNRIFLSRQEHARVAYNRVFTVNPVLAIQQREVVAGHRSRFRLFRARESPAR